MTWFEQLTGIDHESPERVRESLRVADGRLHSRANGRSWAHGELEVVSLEELRRRARAVGSKAAPNSLREVVANVQHLHLDPAHAHALFQVASQFNLLEMSSPGLTPEAGVGIYEDDHTQGPACAIAAGAGTIYRNDFVPLAGRSGQTADHQIDCLADVGALLGNRDQRLWRMTNGYALPTPAGLCEINRRLDACDGAARDRLRAALRIGLQWGTQVTLEDAGHRVSQAYCSALPVAYTSHALEEWAPWARLILEAAYEATLCAAVVNHERTGSSALFLTLLGGGAFGNHPDWIFAAVRRALALHADAGLDIRIVSHGWSNPRVDALVRELS